MKRMRRTFAAIIIITLLVSTACLFSGCSSSGEKPEAISAIDQLNGRVIGCATGSVYRAELDAHYPDSTILEYNSYADMISALKTGRVDAYVADEPLVMSQLEEVDGLKMLEPFIAEARYGFMLNKDSGELCNRINEMLRDLKQAGELERLKEKWVDTAENHKISIPEPWDKSKGTLEVGLLPDSNPFAYYVEGEYVGYDVELMYMLGARLGYDINITPYDFNSVVSSLVSKRADIVIGCITYTKERAESVLFTDSTYDSGLVAVVSASAEGGGLFGSIANSFRNTFIQEQRWKMILEGLLVTVELSLLTLVFGSLLGFGFSFLLRSKNRLLHGVSKSLSTLLDGLPILIILMVLYYIVFVKTSLSPILIGVIGLSVDFANAVAGALNLGISGVAPGEIEAAYSMGYSKWLVFKRIVFPQAVNNGFSQYTGSVIAMIKGTSVIGYITVIDLTKAGDIIRSRTYEAFFPLIAIALIYFAIARIFVVILKLLSKRIDPKHRKRALKGVQTND